MQNCASFSFICFFFVVFEVSLKCTHDIFNVTMVFPLVLVSVMGEHLLRTCQLLCKYLKV